MTGSEGGGNLILHLFRPAVGSAGTHSLALVMVFLVRVSCEFAGSTCCNLHAEYSTPDCVLWRRPWWKELSEKAGLVIIIWGDVPKKLRPPPQTEWVNIFLISFDVFWNIPEVWWLILSSVILTSFYHFPNFILRKSRLTLWACDIKLLHRIYQPSRRSDDLRW